MLSAEQSLEYYTQSSEHEVANEDWDNIVHKHFLFYGLYTIMKIHYVQFLPLGFSDGVERAALGIAIEVGYETWTVVDHVVVAPQKAAVVVSLAQYDNVIYDA